jgi:hypothetical protein
MHTEEGRLAWPEISSQGENPSSTVLPAVSAAQQASEDAVTCFVTVKINEARSLAPMTQLQETT